MRVVEAASELRWFWSAAESELGLHAASLEPRAPTTPGHEVASRRAGAAARYSDVSRRLAGLPAGAERVLRVTYTPTRWPLQLSAWREEGPVAALLVERREAPAGIVSQHMLRRHEADAAGALMRAAVIVAGLDPSSVLARELRDQARQTLRRALEAYAQTP